MGIEEVFEVKSPTINQEQVAQSLRNRMANRSRDDELYLPTFGVSDPSIETKKPQNAIEYHLWHLQRMDFAVQRNLIPSSLPILGRLTDYLKRQFHDLVLYYVNILAAKQAAFNAEILWALRSLARDVYHIQNQKKASEIEMRMVKVNYAQHNERMPHLQQGWMKPRDDEGERIDAQSLEDLLGKVPENNHIESCLELGSAWGRAFAQLEKHYPKVIGIDLHHPSVKAGVHLGYKIVLGLIEYLPFKDNSFDLVVSRHTMEHTYDVNKTLADIKRILKPNGIIATVTPHFSPDPEPAHLTQLTMNEWVELYENLGFQVLAVKLKNYRSPECHIIARKEAN
ncbi:MAG: class I SAM-dependent methyltransferase [Chloroflexi bacterium]|nr:class I SAM-dependent methyltransferase [Chloroflexota bacterium]